MAEDTIWFPNSRPRLPGGPVADRVPRGNGLDMGGRAVLMHSGIPDRVVVPSHTPHPAASGERRITDSRVEQCVHGGHTHAVTHMDVERRGSEPQLYIAACPDNGWTFYTLGDSRG